MCSETSFSDMLYNLCESVASAPIDYEDSFLFSTPNHAMAVKIKREATKIKIIFYDPNDTNRTKDIYLSSAKAAKNLTIRNFLSPIQSVSYSTGSFYNLLEEILTNDLNITFSKIIKQSYKKVSIAKTSILNYVLATIPN